MRAKTRKEATWEEIKDGFKTEIKGYNILYWPIDQFADIIIPDVRTYIRLPIPKITYGGQEIREKKRELLMAIFRNDTYEGFHEGNFWDTEIYLELLPESKMLDCVVSENDQEWFHAIRKFMQTTSIKEIKEWMVKTFFTVCKSWLY